MFMLTPCIICEKAIVSLNHPCDDSLLADASTVSFSASVTSSFYGFSYQGLCCDPCLDNLIQRRKLNIN